MIYTCVLSPIICHYELQKDLNTSKANLAPVLWHASQISQFAEERLTKRNDKIASAYTADTLLHHADYPEI